MNDSNELLKLKLDLQNIKSIPEHEKNPCSLEYINGHKIANSNLFGTPTDRSAPEGSMAESEYRLRMAKKAIEKAAENRMKEEEQRIIEEEKILRALEIDSYTTLAEQDLEEYRKGLITISDFNEKLIEVINLKNFYILQAYKRVLRNNGSIIKLSKHGLESV